MDRDFLSKIRLFFLILFFPMMAFSERGIVVAVNDTYAKNYFIASLDYLRNHIKCDLPIEVWHSGDELSKECKQILKKFSGVSFHDIAEVLHVDKELYRGWQIKPWIIQLSKFEEVILMDADLFFFENPEILFKHSGYLQTKAFFFRDAKLILPQRLVYTANVEKFLDRRNFIVSLIPNPSKYLPTDFKKKMWSKKIPTYDNPFISDLGESGCVVINKNFHQKSLEYIIELNENRNDTYKHVDGDKETFWMGCEMAEMPYYMNDQWSYELVSDKKKIHTCQFVGDQFIYIQKVPFNIDKMNRPIFIDFNNHKRLLTDRQADKINQCVKCIASAQILIK